MPPRPSSSSSSQSPIRAMPRAQAACSACGRRHSPAVIDRGVDFDRASQFLGDLGRQPELAQLFAELGMLPNDRVDVGILTLMELLSAISARSRAS